VAGAQVAAAAETVGEGLVVALAAGTAALVMEGPQLASLAVMERLAPVLRLGPSPPRQAVPVPPQEAKQCLGEGWCLTPAAAACAGPAAAALGLAAGLAEEDPPLAAHTALEDVRWSLPAPRALEAQAVHAPLEAVAAAGCGVSHLHV
jgi:hypothetical protein